MSLCSPWRTMPIVKMLPAAALALCAVAAVAQESKQETRHLIVTTSASQETVAPGKRLSLTVDVAPKPEMHVYSPGQAGYIGVALTLDADPAVTAAKAKYPAGEKVYMPLLEETQLVYTKPFRIAQERVVRPVRGATALTIKATLH